jgi:hypothetical protein
VHDNLQRRGRRRPEWLDFLFAIRDRVLPPPPIARLMGFRLVLVERGLAVFECTPDESAYVCTLAESLRPVTEDSGPIRATRRMTKPGRKVAYATIEVTDESGKLLVQATSSCLVMDHRPAA